MPQFGFLLDDLTRLDEAMLRARVLTAPARVTLLLLTRAAGNPHLAQELHEWVEDLRAVLNRAGGTAMFRALVTYIELAGGAPPEDLQHLMQQVGPDAEEVYMTTADMLRAEGEVRGRAEALLQMVTLRFGTVTETTAATVRAATVEQIESWTARVLTATTIDDLVR